jgi:hypothetical protein
VRVTSSIVAGDGYAYLGYDYPELNVNCSTGDTWVAHLRLLRINSAGAYSIITVADVPAPPNGGIVPQDEVVTFNMISSADTGGCALLDHPVGGGEFQ